MCGRIACSLYPDEIQQACAYKDRDDNWKIPDWQECPSGKEYIQSYNITPSSHTPVMISKKHFTDDAEANERLLQPMIWGISMPWKPEGGGIHNARSESIMQKPTFSKSLKEGRRCVIIADGYYEWKTSGKKKQPYFIYFPQKPGICIEYHDWRDDGVWSENEGWEGPRLLTMAGIFQVSKPKKGAEVYSYAILTRSAGGSGVSAIHERMPVILGSDEAVEDWLDFENVSANKALQLTNKTPKLHFHMVSDIVNSSRNKTPACVIPIESSKTDSGMVKWLKGKKSSPISEQAATPSTSGTSRRRRKQTRPSQSEDEESEPPVTKSRRSHSGSRSRNN